jgi:antitoxin VapB
VALPPNVRQVEVTKLGRSRLFSPADQSWDAFFDGPGASDDFMAERQQPRRESANNSNAALYARYEYLHLRY